MLLGKITSPHALYERYISAATSVAASETNSPGINAAFPGESELFYEFSFNPYYAAEPEEINLSVLCKFSPRDIPVNNAAFSAVITMDVQLAKKIEHLCDGHSFTEIAELLNLDVINFSEPLALETVEIAKPWGAEIWYTGIEARGVSRINNVPLPWLAAINPTLFDDGSYPDSAKDAEVTKISNEPVLLKILAPRKEEIYGDLYFELHREKIEVYIVTHIDPEAWPTGIANMRYGFCQKKLALLGDKENFAQAYLTAVKDYKVVRDSIDKLLALQKSTAGFDEDEIVPAATLAARLRQLPAELTAAEQRLREEMNSFTADRQVMVGDVIEVERLTPHSLQHGIRAIEFQSPHYERYILSFAQKVLTQNHWDTQAAMAIARFEATPPRPLVKLPTVAGITIELAADFDSFQVQRISLAPGMGYQLESSSYMLAIGLIGETRLARKTIEPEQAYCLAPGVNQPLLKNESALATTVLIAIPKSGTAS